MRSLAQPEMGVNNTRKAELGNMIMVASCTEKSYMRCRKRESRKGPPLNMAPAIKHRPMPIAY